MQLRYKCEPYLKMHKPSHEAPMMGKTYPTSTAYHKTLQYRTSRIDNSVRAIVWSEWLDIPEEIVEKDAT